MLSPSGFVCIHFGNKFVNYFILKDTVSPPERCDFMFCNNIIIMYFDRYLPCFGIKIQIILANLYKLKIEY